MVWFSWHKTSPDALPKFLVWRSPLSMNVKRHSFKTPQLPHPNDNLHPPEIQPLVAPGDTDDPGGWYLVQLSSVFQVLKSNMSTRMRGFVNPDAICQHEIRESLSSNTTIHEVYPVEMLPNTRIIGVNLKGNDRFELQSWASCEKKSNVLPSLGCTTKCWLPTGFVENNSVARSRFGFRLQQCQRDLRRERVKNSRRTYSTRISAKTVSNRENPTKNLAVQRLLSQDRQI